MADGNDITETTDEVVAPWQQIASKCLRVRLADCETLLVRTGKSVKSRLITDETDLAIDTTACITGESRWRLISAFHSRDFRGYSGANARHESVG